jgi:hypothetical protein
MSYRSATSRPCTVWRRVDGSPDTVAALLHSTIESPCTVACSLCETSRLAPYCHRLVVSMSCTYLMLPIRCVWLSYTYLMRCLLHVDGEVMMSLMSGVLEMHGHASKAGGPSWVSRSAEYFPFACGPNHAESHVARGDARALPALGGRSGTARLRVTQELSPTGGGGGVTPHVSNPHD